MKFLYSCGIICQKTPHILRQKYEENIASPNKLGYILTFYDFPFRKSRIGKTDKNS